MTEFLIEFLLWFLGVIAVGALVYLIHNAPPGLGGPPS